MDPRAVPREGPSRGFPAADAVLRPWLLRAGSGPVWISSGRRLDGRGPRRRQHRDLRLHGLSSRLRSQHRRDGQSGLQRLRIPDCAGPVPDHGPVPQARGYYFDVLRGPLGFAAGLWIVAGLGAAIYGVRKDKPVHLLVFGGLALVAGWISIGKGVRWSSCCSRWAAWPGPWDWRCSFID